MEPKQKYTAEQAVRTQWETYLNIPENNNLNRNGAKKKFGCQAQDRENQKKKRDSNKYDLRGNDLVYVSYYNCYEAYIKLQRTYAQTWSWYYDHKSRNIEATGRHQNDMIVNLHRSYIEAWNKFYEQNPENGDPEPTTLSHEQHITTTEDVIAEQSYQPLLVSTNNPEEKFLDNYDFFQKSEVQPSVITLPNPKEPYSEISESDINQNSEYNSQVRESRSWFGFLKNFKPKPVKQMILPDDNNPTIVWNESKKCWLNTEEKDLSEEIKPIKNDSIGMNHIENPFRRKKRIEYKNIFNE